MGVCQNPTKFMSGVNVYKRICEQDIVIRYYLEPLEQRDHKFSERACANVLVLKFGKASPGGNASKRYLNVRKRMHVVDEGKES